MRTNRPRVVMCESTEERRGKQKNQAIFLFIFAPLPRQLSSEPFRHLKHVNQRRVDFFFFRRTDARDKMAGLLPRLTGRVVAVLPKVLRDGQHRSAVRHGLAEVGVQRRRRRRRMEVAVGEDARAVGPQPCHQAVPGRATLRRFSTNHTQPKQK